MLVEPQVVGLLVGVALPNDPDARFHPVAGEMDQLLLFSKLHWRFVPTSIPLMDVFVKVAVELAQMIVAGAIVKFACGLVDVVIGSTVDSENPQGFSARIRMKNELGLLAPVTPQEEDVKLCV